MRSAKLQAMNPSRPLPPAKVCLKCILVNRVTLRETFPSGHGRVGMGVTKGEIRGDLDYDADVLGNMMKLVAPRMQTCDTRTRDYQGIAVIIHPCWDGCVELAVFTRNDEAARLSKGLSCDSTLLSVYSSVAFGFTLQVGARPKLITPQHTASVAIGLTTSEFCEGKLDGGFDDDHFLSCSVAVGGSLKWMCVYVNLDFVTIIERFYFPDSVIIVNFDVG
jgi:hypothetical protein